MSVRADSSLDGGSAGCIEGSMKAIAAFLWLMSAWASDG
jgi:hypothetical protein